MVERSAVNRNVVGSSPTRGVLKSVSVACRFFLYKNHFTNSLSEKLIITENREYISSKNNFYKGNIDIEMGLLE